MKIKGVVNLKKHQEITLKDNSNIIVFDYDGTLKINVSNSARVVINIISFKNNSSFNLETYQEEDSCLKIFYSFKNKTNNNIKIFNYVTGDNNTCKTYIRGINKGEIDIELFSKVEEKTFNNGIVQDVKIINEDGITRVDPNMGVNTSEVNANHFVSIYNINNEELFYLMSKGLCKINAKELIKNGLLYGVLEGSAIKLIKEVYDE